MPQTSLVIPSVISKSAGYTANVYDDIAQLDATSTSFTVNLPSAAVVLPGKVFRFKRVDAVSANTITIDAFG